MATKFNPIDSIIFHRVLIEGQKERISEKVIKKLDDLIIELRKAIKNRESNNIDILQQKIKSIIDEKYIQLENEYEKELTELLEYEAEYQSQWLNKTVEEIPEEDLVAEATAVAAILLLSGSKKLNRFEIQSIVLNNKPRGATLKEEILSQKNQLQELIRRRVIVSINEGADDDSIINEVGKIFNKNKAATTALLKTVINAHTNDVAEQTYQNNGIRFYKYVAILDAVTTKICKSLNGKIFQLLNGPKPPQHYGCRSFIIPILAKDLEEESFKAFKERSGDVRIKTDDKGNFKKSDEFNFTLNKMKKEDKI